MLGDQLRASALAAVGAPSPDDGISANVSRGTTVMRRPPSVPDVMVLQGPGIDQIEETGRAPGHHRHNLPEAGTFHLAGSAATVPVMWEAVQACQDLEVGHVLALGVAGGVAPGVAAAGFEAVADRSLLTVI